MVVRLLLLVVLVTAACSAPPTPPRIALLAPFEGRYREIGYQALYAVRLAIAEHTGKTVDLLAVDDGGSSDMARQRAQALTHDPLVKMVIVLGHAATSADTIAALDPLPVIVAGEWGTAPAPHVFVLSHPAITEAVTLPPRTDIIEAAAAPAPLTGGLTLTLEQFPILRESLTGVRIVTTAPLPAPDFRERYLASDLFVPEPGPIAVLAYDAGRIAAASVESQDHAVLAEQVTAYRAAANLHYLRYSPSGTLVPVN